MTYRAPAGSLVLLALLLCGSLPSCLGTAAAAAKRSYGFRIKSREFQPTMMRRSLLRNATMPLHGAVKDYGYFYATLYLGTPAKKFAVIVDTGSTMTYVPCSTCGSGCGPNHQDAAFDPEASSTAQLIGCTSEKCSCGSPKCGCSNQQCTYTRSYAEQSSSSGILLEDVLALHDGLPGAPIIFGCETRETGEIYKQRADGLFGLGNSDASVVNQLVKAGLIDDVFSLCFGMVEGDGALLLGDAEVPGTISVQYTPLLTSATHPFYYNVKMLSLAVDGQLLPVSQSLFDQGYGTVLDSGTTFTYMPSPVFQAFASAVEAYALSHGLKLVPGPDPQYDDICFGQAPSHEDLEALSAVFPSMEITFDEGTALVLGPLNYLFVHTFNSGKYCLGVFDNGRAGTLLGGITFRNVLVRYDRQNQRVGFGPAPCKELGEMQRPPCTFFATEGEGEITAATAAADGDCSLEPLRQQQQETFDDFLGSADSTSSDLSGLGDSEADLPTMYKPGPGMEEQPAGGRRAPGDEPAAEYDLLKAAGMGAGAAGTQQQDAWGELDGPAAYVPERSWQQRDSSKHTHAGLAPAGGSSSKDGGGSGRMTSVVLGMVVAAAAVVSLGLAVALLQPATRDRLHNIFGRPRQYRTLNEDELDPEGGFTPAAAAAGAAAVRAPAGGSGHDGTALELTALGDEPNPINSSTPLRIAGDGTRIASDAVALYQGGFGSPQRFDSGEVVVQAAAAGPSAATAAQQ